MQKRSNEITASIVTVLWSNWAVAFGAIALSLVFPRIMPHFWLPIPIYVLSYLVVVYMRRREIQGMYGHLAVLKASSLTLFWSATVMLVINIMQRNGIGEEIFHWSTGNPNVPFITGLVIFPIMTLMSLWVMFTGYGQSITGDFRFKEGTVDGASVISSFMTHANRYQLTVFLTIAFGISCIDWWYYFKYYINVNMNTPDVFFFNWMSIIFYVASLYFIWVRYNSIGMLVGPILSANRQGVLVRYLVLSGDKLLLSVSPSGRWDTPAELHIAPSKAHNEREIQDAFKDITGYDDFSLKYLYESGTTKLTSMQLHYAAILPEEESEKDSDEGQWFTIDQIDRLLRNAELGAELTDEIYRLFTITMAWKTYDRQGRRLYPIKNYRPTFRLRDLKDWTVDYDDPMWMVVARNNQDRPFFRTRRLWHKLTGLRLR